MQEGERQVTAFLREPLLEGSSAPYPLRRRRNQALATTPDASRDARTTSSDGLAKADGSATTGNGVAVGLGGDGETVG